MPFRVHPCKARAVSNLRTSRQRVSDELAELRSRNSFTGGCKSFLRRGLLTLSLAVLPGTAASSAQAPTDATVSDTDVQQLVDTLRTRLGITAAVTAALVEQDVRVASVRRAKDEPDAFVLTVERRLVARLPPAQLEAALAHELGHVWIYTHHPYLQTEQLANRVAMRVVRREQLLAVYRTLWGADAVHGSLEVFLGVEPRAKAQQ